MSTSLKDQLIKAGLVSKKQAHEARSKKPRGQQATQVRKQQKSKRDKELQAFDAHKREKDRELNAQRETQRKAREQADWVRQLLASHGLQKKPPSDDDPAFHFSMGKAVEHLYLGAEQRREMSLGKLGIVSFDGKYHLLPIAVARQLHEKIPNRTWLPDTPASEQGAAEDDPYADFEVPDDLMW
ncbi:MAG: DUF2058 domain-containing protein [Oceanococcus sp.]